jgi:anti-sigma B factor antagonist
MANGQWRMADVKIRSRFAIQHSPFPFPASCGQTRFWRCCQFVMATHFTVNRIEKFSVIEFRLSSLMDPIILDDIGRELIRLVEEEDRRQLIMDFEKIEYVSSQAIGILLNMHKKLKALPHSHLILCSVPPKIMELLKITRLDKVLTIKPSQKEAIKVMVV